MVRVMLTVGDHTVCKSTEVKITVQHQARDCFIHGKSYAHCVDLHTVGSTTVSITPTMYEIVPSLQLNSNLYYCV
jgi:hypothetical protein